MGRAMHKVHDILTILYAVFPCAIGKGERNLAAGAVYYLAVCQAIGKNFRLSVRTVFVKHCSHLVVPFSENYTPELAERIRPQPGISLKSARSS